MTGKAPDAFRTISEVAEWLGVNAHVLRFWESKFSQVKPVKRAGGRRYYRPSDMELLGGIQKLLHEDGMTIKGVQKILREKGVRTVCAMSRPLNGAVVETDTAPLEEPRTEETVASTLHGSAADTAPADSEPEVPATMPSEEPEPLSESSRAEPFPPDPELEAPDLTEMPPAGLEWAEPGKASEKMPEPTDTVSDLEEPAELEPPADTYAGSSQEDGLPLFGHPPSGSEPQSPERAEPLTGDVAHVEPPEGAERALDPVDAPPEDPMSDVPGVATTLAEVIGQLAPGQIDPAVLRPIHARLVELRTRMDLGA